MAAWKNKKIALSSKPVTITVNPLPTAGKPISFDGAVGKFTISATIPQMSIAANETVVMNILLKGDGNLPLINAPQVQWPTGTEGYEPTVKENIDKTVAPIRGTKMFQYSFTAKQAGTVIIGPVAFSYFDPGANAYKIIQTDSITITVNKAVKKARQSDTAINGNSRAASTATGFDIKKIWWILPVVVFTLMLLLFNRRKSSPKNKTTVAGVLQKTKEEPTPATADPFEAARFALAAVNSQLFYKETGKATWHMIAEKFNLTSSQLNKPVVMRLLQQANTVPETLQLLESVLNDCELALYTPVHTENDMRQTLEKAEQLSTALSSY